MLYEEPPPKMARGSDTEKMRAELLKNPEEKIELRPCVVCLELPAKVIFRRWVIRLGVNHLKSVVAGAGIFAAVLAARWRCATTAARFAARRSSRTRISFASMQGEESTGE